MALPTWADAVLCSFDDIKKEASDLSQWMVSVNEARQDEVLQIKIALAKDQIEFDLMDRIPKMLADTAYQGFGTLGGSVWGFGIGGLTLTQLDTILDRIKNPDRLRHAAVAKTIFLVFSDYELITNMSFERSPGQLESLCKKWGATYDKRLEQAIRLIGTDANNDGKFDDNERLIENFDILKG